MPLRVYHIGNNRDELYIMSLLSQIIDNDCIPPSLWHTQHMKLKVNQQTNQKVTN